MKKDKFRVRVSLHIRQIVVITLGFLNCQPAVARMGISQLSQMSLMENSVVIADRQFDDGDTRFPRILSDLMVLWHQNEQTLSVSNHASG